jgi:sulfur carrier protein
MDVMVNGERQAVADGATVAELVRELGLPEQGVAVAVEDAVVPRGRWGQTVLLPQQHVEVLTAVQGG